MELSILKHKNYNIFFDNQEIDKAIKEVFELISKTNAYVDKQAPWNLKKTDENRMNVVLSVAIEIIRRSIIMLYPIIPGSTEKILQILNINIKKISFESFDKLPISSLKINKSYPIFPRIESEDQG